MPDRPPVVAVVGWKNSGKTTLVARLVEELSRLGLRVGTIKHAHHRAVMDAPGTDTDRHREAGAVATMLVSDAGWGLRVSEEALSLRQAMDRLPACDVVVLEGYKREPVPKIECRRFAADGPLLAASDPNVIAVAHDGAYDGPLPAFGLEDGPAIALHVCKRLALTPKGVPS